MFIKKIHLKPGPVKMRLFVVKAFRIFFFLVQKFVLLILRH